MNEQRATQLLEIGRSVVAELDIDAVLGRLLDLARDLTGAKYAAVGVLDERRERLARFLTAGIGDEMRRALGEPPRGHGVLGLLIKDARPLRLPDVTRHPQSYGFPAGHPTMRTFLGVPILVEGEAWGNLYLTEKSGGEPFTDEDEQAVVVLAEWAAVALANAGRYGDARDRRDELQRANRVLEVARDVFRTFSGELDLERILELTVKRSRALVSARAATLSLLEDQALVVRGVAGDLDLRLGVRVPLAESVAAPALGARAVQRIDAVAGDTFASRVIGAKTALAVPLVFRARVLGVLALFDRLDGDGRFSAEDADLVEAFAGSATAALASAQLAADEGLRRSLRASEQERQRWARELHDETLQELAGLRVMLAGARRRGDPRQLEAAVDRALEQLAYATTHLRALITDLRPAALDQLGVQPALESLVARVSVQSGLDIDFSFEQADAAARHAPDLEDALYRIVQEALTNAVKHAGARRAVVEVREDDGEIMVVVRDDGLGFDPHARSEGFGLIGMRERAALVGGVLGVESDGAGTTVRARLPVERRPVAPIGATPQPAATDTV